MDKRLLRLVGDQVEAVVKNQPPSSPQSLLTLLNIAEPQLKLSDLYGSNSKSTREAAFRSLQGLIHPDKYVAVFGSDSAEVKRATRLFTDTTDYYHLCVDHLQATNYTEALVVPDNDKVTTYTARTTGERESRPYSMAQQHFRSSRGDLRSVSPPARPTNADKETNALVVDSREEKTNRAAVPPSTTAAATRTTRRRKPTSLSPVRHHVATTRSKDPAYGILEAYAITKKLPVSMNALEVWPFLLPYRKNDHKNGLEPEVTRKITHTTLAWIMSCRVLNSRGAVLHGLRLRAQDCFQVTHSSKLLERYRTVPDVMNHVGVTGQSHLFRSKKDIQHEIIQNGPVLSLNFCPDELFFKQHPNSFQPFSTRTAVNHPVLIVGWTVKKTGQLWKVQSLFDPTSVVHIGFGQWGIDDTIIAPPPATLLHIPWQTPGPYLDLRMPKIGDGLQDWRQSKTLGITIQPHELELLSGILSSSSQQTHKTTTGFQTAIANRVPFVIRDKHWVAYSRRYALKEIVYHKNNKWKIAVERVDAKHERIVPKTNVGATDRRALVPAVSHDLVEV